MRWALYATIPLALFTVLFSQSFTLADPAEFAGGILGAGIVWFFIFYVALQYVLNRPKKT